MLRRYARSPGGDVAAAAEAFVTGRYAESLVDEGRPVPVWAWTNLLAHGDTEQLQQTTKARPSRAMWRRGTWFEARSYLAGEVLDAAASHGSVLTLQRRVLVPLELDLMAQPSLEEATPSEWVTRVLAAIDPTNG